jgi:hypothetical protein
MWLAIIAIVDKLLSLAVSWLPWKLKRSDEAKKKYDEGQAAMDAAVKAGDWDAFDRARADRDSAR